MCNFLCNTCAHTNVCGEEGHNDTALKYCYDWLSGVKRDCIYYWDTANGLPADYSEQWCTRDKNYRDPETGDTREPLHCMNCKFYELKKDW